MFEKRKRVIFHVDVNSAFLSWEAAYRLLHLGGKLDLRTIPSAVAGSVESRHGIILAKSMSAKKYGIFTGMSVTEALKKCPKLYCVPPNYTLYERCSAAFMNILYTYTPDVEQYSIDEAFMDMTETLHLYGGAVETATEIKNRVRSTLGFTINVGVSENKLLAKMAGELKKPDLVHTLYPEEIETKMWPLPVGELFYVGRATQRKLRLLGIETIGELAAADETLLKAHMKKQGEVVKAFANGVDFSEVKAESSPQKGYGNSTTVAFDVADSVTAKQVLLALAETLAARLRAGNVRAAVLSVGLRNKDLAYMSHQMKLGTPTNITWELHKYACILFDQAWDGIPLRQLGIHTSQLSESADFRQMSMFDTTDYGKLSAVDRTVDSIRQRFGKDTLIRASFVKGPIDHLSGGVSREKRTVDYEKLTID